MNSKRRIQSSRANGARSKGPRTSEGIARSSLNALRHGLLAKIVVLPSEARSTFDLLFNGYVECLAPRNTVEYTLVENMAAACWRERRGMAIECTLLTQGINLQPAGDELFRLTDAFRSAAGTPELALIYRYETRLNRIFHRALSTLALLRNGDLGPEPDSQCPFPNEPRLSKLGISSGQKKGEDSGRVVQFPEKECTPKEGFASDQSSKHLQPDSADLPAGRV